MAMIQVETPGGQMVQFEVAGDQPTQEELQQIQRRVTSPLFQAQIEEAQFDTESGIESGLLRAVLSGAESAKEEEAMLARAGFTKQDYTRDRQGRLALTPSGAKKTGVETDKNILIDEEGFSWYDIADLAGISPELVAGVAGAVKGGTLGSAFGPVGTLAGSVVGAAGGAATGNLLEEAVEGAFGVSQQTAEEIISDTATEALYAGSAELVFGTPFLVYKALAPSAKIAKEGGEQLERLGEAVTRGYQPTKRAMGISPISAKLEQVSESVMGVSPRMARNTKQMQEDLARYNDEINEAAALAQGRLAGDVLKQAEKLASDNLVNAQNAARSSIIRQLDESVNILSSGLRKDEVLDDALFASVEDSFRAFQQANTNNFRLVDDVLDTSVGTANILPTNALKELTESFKQRYSGTFLTEAQQEAKQMANMLSREVATLGDKSSFTALYKARENLARRAYQDPLRGFGTNYMMQKSLLDEIDNILTSTNINVLGKEVASEIGDEGLEALARAADSIPSARQFYTEGMKKFEGVDGAITGKNLIEALKSGDGIGSVGGSSFAMQLVKNGDKSPLLNLKAAMKKPAEYNAVRDRIGKEWLRNTFENSGLDSINPNNFNSRNFLQAVDDLGETGKELFGDSYGQIKTLAKRLDNVSAANLSQEALDQALKEGLDESIVSGLRQATLAAEEFGRVTQRNVLNKLADGNLDVDEALDLVLSNKISKPELSAIMNFYKQSGDEGAIKTIRGSYMENMLDGIGPTVNAQKLQELSARIAKADKAKKLDVVFDKEAAEDIRAFGRIMKTLSQDASTSDLVANNITVNFMSNIGRIARISVLGRIFDGSKAVRQIEDAYRAMKGLPPAERAGAISTMINGLFRPVPQASAQLIQSGAEDAANRAKNYAQNTLASMQVTAPSPSSGIGAVDVTQPLSPQIAPVDTRPPAPPRTIREMATNDPAVAEALGIRGPTAGLLNR